MLVERKTPLSGVPVRGNEPAKKLPFGCTRTTLSRVLVIPASDWIHETPLSDETNTPPVSPATILPEGVNATDLTALAFRPVFDLTQFWPSLVYLRIPMPPVPAKRLFEQ